MATFWSFENKGVNREFDMNKCEFIEISDIVVSLHFISGKTINFEPGKAGDEAITAWNLFKTEQLSNSAQIRASHAHACV